MAFGMVHHGNFRADPKDRVHPDAPGSEPRDTNPATGFAEGAEVISTRGKRRVQDLRVGDHVVTRGNGIVPIRRIDQHSLVTAAVYVVAGSLGHRDRHRDTLLPEHQAVLVRDWRARAMGRVADILLPAKELVDGEYVRQLGFQPMTLFRIWCDAPQILYADGMELGTADALTEVLPSMRHRSAAEP